MVPINCRPLPHNNWMDLVLLIKSRFAFSPAVEKGEVLYATSFFMSVGLAASLD